MGESDSLNCLPERFRGSGFNNTSVFIKNSNIAAKLDYSMWHYPVKNVTSKNIDFSLTRYVEDCLLAMFRIESCEHLCLRGLY